MEKRCDRGGGTCCTAGQSSHHHACPAGVIPRPPPGHGRAAHRIKTPCPALPCPATSGTLCANAARESTVLISTSSITCCYYLSGLDAPHHLVGGWQVAPAFSCHHQPRPSGSVDHLSHLRQRPVLNPSCITVSINNKIYVSRPSGKGRCMHVWATIKKERKKLYGPPLLFRPI
jgi:hypothetical protein